MTGAENFTIRIDNSQLIRDAKTSADIFRQLGENGENAGRRLDDSMAQHAESVNRMFANVGGNAEQAGSRIETAFKRAGAAIGIALSLDGLKNFTRQIIDVRANMESLETSFSVLLGNAEKGRQLFAQLREFAATTPLELPDLAKDAQTLLGFGIQAKDVMGILKDIGNISMGDKNKMESLTLAFAQATSTGKLMGQDLLQMINAGFNPLETIAAKTGKSIGELKEEMAQGAISAQMLRDAYAEAAGAGGKFDNMLLKQSETIRGMRSNLNDTIEMALNDVGKKIEPATVKAIELAQSMVEHWEQIGKAILDVAVGFGTYKAAMLTMGAISNAVINQQIAGYQALLPAKAQSMDADLQAAVASGRYSSAKAAELQALRNEIAAKIKSMEASLKEAAIETQLARIKYQAATRDLVISKQRMAVAQSQVAIAIRGGNAEEIAAAKTAAKTAKTEMQTAAIAKDSAAKALNTATTNRNAISTELDTLRTNANAVSKKSAATATTFLTLATNGLTKAWQALKLAFVSNPIGALITIALTAITTFMTLKDLFAETGDEAKKQATIAEKTAQNFKQKVGEAIDDEIAKISKLKDTIHDSSKTYKERKQAIADMQQIVPDYHASISKEGKLFNDNVTAIDAYIKKLNKAAMAEAAYQLQIENNKKILSLQRDAEDAGDKASRTMSNFQRRTGYGLYQTEGVRDDVREQAEEEQKWVDDFIDRQEKANSQIRQLQQENRKLAKIETENGGHGGENETILDKVREHNQATTGAQTKNGKAQTGRGTDYAERQENARHKFAQQRAKQAREDAYAIEQAEIDGMAEGERKKLEQARLNHEKELDQIEEERRQLYEQRVEHEKALWDAAPQNKGRSFWKTHTRNEETGLVSGISDLASEELKGINARIESENARYEKERAEILQDGVKNLNDYLKEYGSFEERRLAITKDYQEKIAKAQTQGEKNSLQAQLEKEISNLDFEQLKKRTNWEEIFGDLSTLTLEQLRKIKQQLRELINDSTLTIDQYKDAAEQVSKVNDAIVAAEDKARSAMGLLLPMVEERRKLENDVADATERQRDAMAQAANASASLGKSQAAIWQELNRMGISVAQKDITMSGSQAILNSVGDKYGYDSAQYKEMQDAMQKLSEAEREESDASSKAVVATNQLTASQNRLKYFLDDFGSRLKSVSEVMSLVASNMQSIPDLFSSLGIDMSGEFGRGITDLANAGQQASSAVQNFMGGNFIGAAANGVGAIKGVLSGFNNMLSLGIGKGNTKEVNELTDRLTKSNEALRTSIDSLKETIESENGMNAITDTQKAAESQRRIIQNTMDILEAQMGYHGAHHSNAHYWNLRGQDYDQINQVLAEYARRNPDVQTATSTVTRLSDFYKLTPEQMSEIRTNLADVWRKMLEQGKYDKSEYWEAYADLAGDMDEITNTLREKLTGITFDSMHDDFVDKLMDMENKAEDFTKDVNKQFAKSLLNFAVGTQIDARMKKWWESWADTMELQGGKLTEAQIDNMRKEYEEFVAEGVNIRDRVFEITGYNSSSDYSQDSSKSVLSGVTQDQVQELNGRMASVQISFDKVVEQIRLDYERNGTLLATTQDIRGIMDDLMDLQYQGVEHLAKIEVYTSELPGMSQKLEKIRRNTEHL